METVKVYEAPMTTVVELRIETGILAVSDPNGSGENFGWD